MSKRQVHAVIERFDGDIAIIETVDRAEFRVHRSQLPAGCRVGHHLQMAVDEGEVTEVRIDEGATAQAKQHIDELMEKLRRGDHLKKDD